MTVIPPVRARLVDGRLHAYDLSDPAGTGRLSPAAVFDLRGEDGRIEGWAVTLDLRRGSSWRCWTRSIGGRSPRGWWRTRIGWSGSVSTF